MFYVCSSVCGPVGVEDRNIIPDARMTASTNAGSIYYPYYGRLNGNRGNGAWCPRTAHRTEYLQVDMGAVRSVCAVATQGRGKYPSWITSYKVFLSTDGITWNAYKENNVEKVNKFMFSYLEADPEVQLCRNLAFYSSNVAIVYRSRVPLYITKSL